MARKNLQYAVEVIKMKFLKLKADISITKSREPISLSLRNSDVTQVLRMFADKAGLI